MGRPIEELPRAEAYQCLKCEYEWRQPLPDGAGVSCPSCGHLYVEWLTFDCAEVFLNRDLVNEQTWNSIQGEVTIRKLEGKRHETP